MAKQLADLPIGAKVKHVPTRYNGQAIIFKVGAQSHPGYPAQSTTLISDRILSVKAFDAKEPSNGDSNRRNYGNNRYAVSNMRQWLNKVGAGWYSAQHSADQAPNAANVDSGWNPYDAEVGFLSGFSQEFVDAILPTTLTVVKASVDGGGTEITTDKVFLPSTTEVGLANEGGVAEGSKWPLFTNDASRQANPTAQAVSASNYTNTNFNATSPWYWWLRTPLSGYSHSVRIVLSSGVLSGNFAFIGHYGVRPALNLPSRLAVSDAPDADGAYILEFNAPPEINISEPDNKGDQNKPFSVTYNVTDREGDATNVVEKLNGAVIREIPNITLGEQKEIKISEAQWNELPMGEVSEISIEANAANGNGSKKVIKFKKSNNLPTITLDLPNDTTLYQNSELKLEGSANDKDVGDAVTTYFSINKGARKAIGSFVSDATPKAYSKTLTMKTDGQTASLMDNDTVVVAGLAKDIWHTADVWSEDNNGGKSIVLTRRFKVVPNRPPTLEVTKTPNGNDITESEVVRIEGSVIDPDGDTVIITSQVGLDGTEKEVDIGEDGIFNVVIPVSELRNGSNIITIKATDDFGAGTTKQVRVTKDESAFPAPNPVLRFDLQEPPTPVDTIKVWAKIDYADFDVEMYVADWRTGVEEWSKVEYEETTSPTGMKELYFEAILSAPSTKVAIAFTKFKGIKMIIGGMSDSAVEGRLAMVEGAMMDLTDIILGGE